MSDNDNRDTVLVINLGWEQEPLVEEVARRGYRVVGIHNDDSWNKDLPVSEVVQFDFRDAENILAYARTLQPVAVVADQCDSSLFTMAVVCEALSLPGPRIEQAQLTTNKWLQRECGSKEGVLQPEYELCRNPRDVKAAANKLGYPLILKPLDNRGSFGVNRVDCEKELQEAYLEAVVNAHSRLVLAEEFIAGVHITVDGYLFPQAGHHSLTLATKEMIGGRRQVAMDIFYPGKLTPEFYDHVIETNNKVIAALGLRFGMTHAEYMLTDKGDCYLIEVANRGGGCYTSAKIVPAVSGIDLTSQLVNDVTGSSGDSYVEKADRTESAAILSFFSFSAGEIAEIVGLDEALALPGVEALRLAVGVGDVIEPITTDGNRHGFVIASGEDIKAARKAIEQVKGKIEVKYVS